MFFCMQDPMSKMNIPDLEPIRVTVRNLRPDDTSKSEAQNKQMILIS